MSGFISKLWEGLGALWHELFAVGFGLCSINCFKYPAWFEAGINQMQAVFNVTTHSERRFWPLFAFEMNLHFRVGVSSTVALSPPSAGIALILLSVNEDKSSNEIDRWWSHCTQSPRGDTHGRLDERWWKPHTHTHTGCVELCSFKQTSRVSFERVLAAVIQIHARFSTCVFRTRRLFLSSLSPGLKSGGIKYRWQIKASSNCSKEKEEICHRERVWICVWEKCA